VRCALAAGDQSAARAAVQLCEEETRRGQVGPRVLAVARHCVGLVDNNPEPLAEAVTLYRAVGFPARLAQAFEDLAVVYGSRGALAAARTALREAVDIYTGLGAEWFVMRADARSRPYGVRRRREGSGSQGSRRPATGWEALTPTETKIAYLVAEGLSNPDIGTRLFLSWRTIRYHVSSIMGKLGVHSRIEIAREVARHPQTATSQAVHPTAP
jgi:DNA-binding CsgD family transcriptional regulator